MPWLTIILALLSFFGAKKAGASNTGALLTAGLVGGAAYFTTHETEWGRANLGALDGVELGVDGGEPVLSSGTDSGIDRAAPSSVLGSTGTPVRSGTGVFDVLKSWGATGTAAVIGTAAVTTGLLSNPVVLIGGALAIFLLMK